jgi:hypothetical protein
LWYGEPNAIAHAIGYARHFSRAADTVIRVHDAGGNVIERRAQGRSQRLVKLDLKVAPWLSLSFQVENPLYC